MRFALLTYAIGVAVGLVFTDARPPARLALAALWPVGPLAFGAVIALLGLASLVIFPVFGGAVALAAVAGWWAFFR